MNIFRIPGALAAILLLLMGSMTPACAQMRRPTPQTIATAPSMTADEAVRMLEAQRTAMRTAGRVMVQALLLHGFESQEFLDTRERFTEGLARQSARLTEASRILGNPPEVATLRTALVELNQEAQSLRSAWSTGNLRAAGARATAAMEDLERVARERLP